MRAFTMIGLGVLALVAGASCYREYEPAAPMYQPQPMVVYGPPGGGMDPVEATYGGTAAGYAEEPAPQPSSDPQDPGYVMGTVTDAEIDATLQPYGEWVVVEDYGRVWRPYTTVVGANFTPYETCGSWIWTDYGWTFACDWDWGWLPFHYGQWGWLDTGWYWFPDYTWSPAWVDWRYGSGYVGWRPTRPRVVDHRDGRVGDHRSGGPRIRDHRRRSGDADWRFSHERDFGRGRIRGNLEKNPAEGLRVTSTVARPPVRTTTPPIRAAELMRSRLGVRHGANRAWSPSGRPATVRPTPSYPSRPTYQPSRPTYQPARPTYQPSRPTYQPSRPTYQPSRPTYQPSRPTYQPSRPTYQPARPTYQPSTRPSRPSYDRPSSPPSRPSYDRPSSPPSRSSYDRPSSPPSRSYDRPSSSSSSHGSSGSRWGGSSGSSSRGSSSSSSSSRGGGGGRRR